MSWSMCFSLGLSTPGHYVKVSIEDNGAGMSEEVKARAFDPFFTTKDIGTGSGLGLSQVYGFAKSVDGHVEIESETGLGTTITLLLPKSPEPARAGSVAEPPAAEAGPRQWSGG